MTKVLKHPLLKSDMLAKLSNQMKDSKSELSDFSDLMSDSDHSSHRRRPTKKSRVNHTVHNKGFESDDNISDLGDSINDIILSNSKSLAGTSNQCIIGCNQCATNPKPHVKQEIGKLDNSYMEIDILILQGLLLALAPYLLYSGVKHNNRVLFAIGIFLLLYCVSNLCMYSVNCPFA